jgi:sec-independent protein translocase protein TatA
MLSSIGPMELIVVLVIALIVLGPKRLPEAGKSLGRGLREFKGAMSNHDDDDAAAHELPGAVAAAPEPVAAGRHGDPVA